MCNSVGIFKAGRIAWDTKKIKVTEVKMMDNCKTCVFHGQWCEKENKCPLFKEPTENESEHGERFSAKAKIVKEG